ncbi:enoyl-CoA hydratase [Rhizoctonia solani AG-1 IB]|uniref:Enoyl-CoA hydratase n=1 Tax=Thanatephorus cucumeris (strain AG1-IB / isolate 7/3/14) TaxID=1108050 RepID=M5CFS9_THACB|nr:enoyl-CoA hydratase [Rhizoctonia solani AG-1 IB]
MSEFAKNKLVRVTTPLEDKSILLVELNRGPVNAFNQPFWEELGSTFDTISRDGTVRVVVLSSSNPKIFTAGLDLSDSGSLVNSDRLDPARQAFKLRSHLMHFQSCISAIERCNQPVIAAVNGVAYGLAIDILCACDVRYSSSNTRFSIKEVDVGLAADIGTLSRLPKITGNESLLRELAFTAREFGPAEATQLGMVSRVVQGGRDEVLGAALELARVIASKSPVAVVGTKRFLLHARDHTVDQSLEYQATWNMAMLQSSDTTEAFKSFTTKRPPRFQSLPKL